jgi:hypothetical protein
LSAQGSTRNNDREILSFFVSLLVSHHLRNGAALENSQRGGQGKAAVAPRLQASLQRAYALDAIFSQEQRHTGTGGFVRSSTVKNDFDIAGQPVVFLLELFGLHVQRARNHLRLGLEIQRMAEVNNGDLLAGINFFL